MDYGGQLGPLVLQTLELSHDSAILPKKLNVRTNIGTFLKGGEHPADCWQRGLRRRGVESDFFQTNGKDHEVLIQIAGGPQTYYLPGAI
jgi:hypothetical protein